MNARTKALGLTSGAFPGVSVSRTWIKVEQPVHKPAPLGDARVANAGFACSATVLAQNFTF